MADENENVTENETETEAVDPTAEAEAAPEAEAEAEVVAEAVAEPPAEASAEPVPEPEAEPIAAEVVTEPAAETVETPEGASQAGAETPEGASQKKKKKKRVPRSERPQRTKRTREKASERKPITRLPKPEHERGRRQERQGTVVSAAADKTIVVRVDVVKAHPTYKKVIRRSTRFHAHDERNEAKPGDIVRIVETRPLSKLKRWRLQEIVEAAK
jgi:small subunit ribosomal protein S17